MIPTIGQIAVVLAALVTGQADTQPTAESLTRVDVEKTTARNSTEDGKSDAPKTPPRDENGTSNPIWLSLLTGALAAVPATYASHWLISRRTNRKLKRELPGQLLGLAYHCSETISKMRTNVVAYHFWHSLAGTLHAGVNDAPVSAAQKAELDQLARVVERRLDMFENWMAHPGDQVAAELVGRLLSILGQISKLHGRKSDIAKAANAACVAIRDELSSPISRRTIASRTRWIENGGDLNKWLSVTEHQEIERVQDRIENPVLRVVDLLFPEWSVNLKQEDKKVG